MKDSKMNSIHNQLIEQYIPPSVIVNEAGEILSLANSAEKYLISTESKSILNFFKILDVSVLNLVKDAIAQADREERTTISESIYLMADGVEKRVQLIVNPIKKPKSFLIVFNENKSKFKSDISTSNRDDEDSKNEGLKNRINELNDINRDLEKQIESAHMALIYLDDKLRIKQFSLKTKDVFNIHKSDIGRPLSEIKTKLSPDHFSQDAANVLKTHHPYEREVHSNEGRSFIAKFSTYDINESEGVVMSFEDITDREMALHRIEEERSYAQFILDSVPVPFVILNENSKIITASLLFYQTYKTSKKEIEGKSIFDIRSGKWNIPDLKIALNEVLNHHQNHFEFENEFLDEDEQIHTMLFAGSEIKRSSQSDRHIFLSIQDITNRKKADQILRESEEEKSLLLQIIDVTQNHEDIIDIEKNMAQIMMRHFDADRCFYLEISSLENLVYADYHREGLRTICGVYPANEVDLLSSIGNRYVTLQFEDIENSEVLSTEFKSWCYAAQIASMVIVPIEWAGDRKNYFVLSRTSPGNLCKFDIGLIEKVARRSSFLLAKMRAQIGLKKSEEKYQTLFNSMDEGYCIIKILFDEENNSNDYTFIEVNNSFVKQSGKAVKAGDKVLDIAPNLEPQWFENYKNVARTGRSIKFEMFARDFDRYFESYAYRIGRPEEHLVAVLFQDISERMQYTAALKSSEENYKSIVNQALTGIIKIDSNEKIIFTNDQFCKMLGYDEDEVLGRYFTDFIHHKDRDNHNNKFNALAKNPAGYMIEKRLLRKNGSSLWTNNYNSPIFNPDGSLQSLTIISGDISQQKAIEKQKDDFIGVASHELKTPITSIKAYAEVLKELTIEEENPENFLLIKKLNYQIERMTSLVGQLLDTSKIASGRYVLKHGFFSINELIKEVVSEFQLVAARHELITRLGSDTKVYADRNRIAQVLTNLISNAVKYSPDSREIIIEKIVNDDGVQVGVRDFGTGLAPEEHDKVFKRFYRIESDTSITGGFGLGLTIAKNIIKLHGGKIGVECKDPGAYFYFILPNKQEKL